MKTIYLKHILVAFLLSLSFSSFSQIINTIAGNGVGNFSGNGGPATAAELVPIGVAVDAAGNVYVADYGNRQIRKINTAGIISTFAGTGFPAYSGDGGPAKLADINYPAGVAVDSSGNIYIADEMNNRIRKVNKLGVISTIAGNGAASYSGDGGPATAAELYWPVGVALDAQQNIYVADYQNNRVRKINTSGIITTVAGNGYGAGGGGGYSGDGGDATSAELYLPVSVAVNTLGNIYIAD